jgi:SAM-dependent methyltransferase
MNRVQVSPHATVARIRKAVLSPQGFWRVGLKEEAGFWDRWVTMHGAGWPEDFRDRQDPNLELQADVRRWIDAPTGEVVQILDVGAGPLTWLGKRWDGRVVQITAVDALADRYNKMLADAHIEPLVRTENCHSENLLERFEPDLFDLVHAQNTLDHHYDPVRAIGQMLSVVKPGRHIYLRHKIEEAEQEDHHGLHQWNFSLADGSVLLWNERARVDLAEQFARWATLVHADMDETDWLVVAMQKTASGAVS